MIIIGKYSFNGGEKYIERKYPYLLDEVKDVLKNVKAEEHKTKLSKEKTMPDKILYSPISLNKAFNSEFKKRGWEKVKVFCEYPTKYYIENCIPRTPSSKKIRSQNAFREMDFVKEKLGIEVQFGKYSFMVYNVCAKMTIFKKLGYIDAGIEIVPIKQFADEMSTGVSYFEQFVWDLEKRGVADIDIPVLILGIDTEAALEMKK